MTVKHQNLLIGQRVKFTPNSPFEKKKPPQVGTVIGTELKSDGGKTTTKSLWVRIEVPAPPSLSRPYLRRRPRIWEMRLSQCQILAEAHPAADLL